MPLYDSTDEEADSNFLKAIVQSNECTTTETEIGESLRSTYDTDCEMLSQALPINVEPLSSVPMEIDDGKNEANERSNFYVQDEHQNPEQKATMVSRIRSKSVFRSHQTQPGPLFKSSLHCSNGKSKNYVKRQVNVKFICERLASKEACDELISCEELKNQAASRLDCLYDEIRPAIEERERDSQDSVPTSVAEKWIEASCNNLKAEFDLHSSIIRSIFCTPRRTFVQVSPQADGDLDNCIKYLENGQ